MNFTALNGTVLHIRHRPGQGRGIVFLNSLGTDFRIWDAVAERMSGAPLLFHDKRGHGLSRTDSANMKTYAADAAALIEAHGMGPSLIVGVSIGGMIAQCLALARPDLVAGLVLSNTGARIGDDAAWAARLAALEADGLPAMADAVMERWFSNTFRRTRPAELEGYRAMFSRTATEGYATACRALRDCDLRDRIGAIAAPTVCIAGSEDLATPPDLVRALADAIPDAQLETIDGAAHLPMIENPERMAELILQARARLA